jgi:phosphoesterase RecJ-like protein
MLAVEPGALPADIAAALYLGVATDTGWLRYSNVTPATLRLAADLIEAGAEPTTIYERIEQRERPARIRVLGRALESLHLYDQLHLAILRVTQQDIQDAGAAPSVLGGFSDLPMSIEGVQVVAVLPEVIGAGGDKVTKVSLRSKPGPEAVDVNQVAATIGGGGHARAAGARVRNTLEAVEGAIVRALRQ